MGRITWQDAYAKITVDLKHKDPVTDSRTCDVFDGCKSINVGPDMPPTIYGPVRIGKTTLIRRCGRLLTKKWIGSDLVKRSKFADLHRHAPPNYKELLNRSLVKVTVVKPHLKHTHPDAGSLRTAVAYEMEEVITAAGLTPYSVSMSHRDRYDGCRYHYTAKDLDKTFRNDIVRDKHVLMFIDVDYYCDINAYLRYGQPMLLYTFVPTEAAGQALNCSYKFKDDRVIYTVSGGTKYVHPLWKYDGDEILVRGFDGNMILYNIEQHVLESDLTRRVVGFYPVAYFPVHTCTRRPERLIERFKPCSETVTVIRDEVKLTVSVALKNAGNSATIPEELFNAISIRRKHSKHPVMADVERLLSAAKIDKAALIAPLLFEFMCNVVDGTGDATVSTVPIPVHGYQTLDGLVNEDGTIVGRQLTPSLVTSPAVVPNKSYNNDVSTIQGRVKACRNTSKTPSNWHHYDNELMQFIIPESGIGVPISIEDVNNRQTKAAQRGRAAAVEASMTEDYANKPKAFIKAEAYGAPTHPRNITTVDTAHQLYYSTYTYPFKDNVLKKFSWFASAMKPDDIARRVNEICQYPDGVILSDYTKLDGHISDDDKRFKEKCYMRWVSADYKLALREILRKDRPLKAITAQGVSYEPGTSQLSGSPGTTNDNNLVTLRHDYIGLRQIGYNPQQAWKMLNKWVLGASDDRIRANLPGYAAILEEVATKLGHKLKSEVLHPLDGDLVTFLGRVFVNPHDVTSMQDPLRTLPKLHLTMAPPHMVSLEQAAFNRATGYLVTDSKTPIISNYCSAVLRILAKTHPDIGYKTGVEDYRVTQGPYPQYDEDALLSAMCKLLDIDSSEILSIMAAIDRAETLDQLGEIKYDNSRLFKPKIDCVINGEVIRALIPPDETCLSQQTTTKICVSPKTRGSHVSMDTLHRLSKERSPNINISANTESTSATSISPRLQKQLIDLKKYLQEMPIHIPIAPDRIKSSPNRINRINSNNGPFKTKTKSQQQTKPTNQCKRNPKAPKEKKKQEKTKHGSRHVDV
jgi:hypothetical protein